MNTFERLGWHYVWAHWYPGETRAIGPVVHYPQEGWFPLHEDGELPEGLLNDELMAFQNPDDSLRGEMLIDLNSRNVARGGCALPYTRLSDDESAYIPVNSSVSHPAYLQSGIQRSRA